MAVSIDKVKSGSAAAKAGLKRGETLLSMNGHEVCDVLDYQFFETEAQLQLEIKNQKGDCRCVKVYKEEGRELGLSFETYLMDKQHSCRNKCMFCFIDQLPKGMRETLYFKDDDSRLSFLFGNYITLTNLTDHEVERIISMHISPVNISVHTTDPELRVRMMKNKQAGERLALLKRFSDAGIAMNCQLVLVPGVNDGEALEKSVKDLLALPTVGSVACVPVGLTKYRDGLEKIEPFEKASAQAVLDIVHRLGDESLKENGARRIFASDEFYLKAEQPIPEVDFYEELLQLENGVGMWSLFRYEALRRLEELPEKRKGKKKLAVVTGVAAFPLMKYIVDIAAEKWHNFECEVYAVKNEFFGEKITVAGLITGGDIANQLEGKVQKTEILIPDVMLRHENDMFLDNMTPKQLAKRIGGKVRVIGSDGVSFADALYGGKIK